MKKIIPLLALLALPQMAQAQQPWDGGKLTVSRNGHYFQQADGKPFFWMADTTWLIAQKLNRAQVEEYFTDRKAKGFNVVQMVVFQMLEDKNAYGAKAVVDGNIARLNVTPGADPSSPDQYDYWDHVDFIIDTAAKHGIYVAIAPTWRRAPVTAEQMGAYVKTLAERWKTRPNIIWLNGGSARGDVNADVWDVIGTTLKATAPDQLVSFHPFGRTSSSQWFQKSSWLDFNMFVSGHRRYDQDVDGKKYGEDNWRYTMDDVALSPARPVVDGEPAYENTPQGLHKPEEPYWNGDDARRYAYWSVFAGAAGHTYGENTVRQVFLPEDAKSASGAKGYFRERLNEPGARAMRHVKALMLSRPYFDRVSDQAAVAGDEGALYDRVLVTRGKDYLMAYTYTGRDFTINMGRISGKTLVGWWYNPRTGEATRIGEFANKGAQTFNPPADKANGNDWVLVLDDAAKAFAEPGKPIS